MPPKQPCGHFTTVKATSDVECDNLHRCVGCGTPGVFVPLASLRPLGEQPDGECGWDEAGAIAGLRAGLLGFPR